jgi:hypothetical protein
MVLISLLAVVSAGCSVSAGVESVEVTPHGCPIEGVVGGRPFRAYDFNPRIAESYHQLLCNTHDLPLSSIQLAY